jgi:exopolyphosphatase/guanosine-5'-triphosphate,3'-diphosphate pyrophosphatase
MRFAVIDLGTNSVRFDVHQLGKKAKLLHREKLMIRLGQEVFLKGKLNKDAIDRASQAFIHFAKVARKLQTDRMIAFGTSALRESKNGAAFVEHIRNVSGIELRVISGQEEARFIAAGILRNEKKLPPRFALIDIGGGSTEVSICKKNKAAASHSFPLGTARMQQVFLKKNPPAPPPISISAKRGGSFFSFRNIPAAIKRASS